MAEKTSVLNKLHWQYIQLLYKEGEGECGHACMLYRIKTIIIEKRHHRRLTEVAFRDEEFVSAPLALARSGPSRCFLCCTKRCTACWPRCRSSSRRYFLAEVYFHQFERRSRRARLLPHSAAGWTRTHWRKEGISIELNLRALRAGCC
jgi:hypothetical protein